MPQSTLNTLRPLLIIVAIAVIGRALILVSDTVSFHSDEAVVGLMARHILEGERPTFFYGQAYMGSLDPYLVAVGFAVLSESVLTIRIVQSILYVILVIVVYFCTLRISGRVNIATAAGLLIAVPPVLVALYTTATLGGYVEMLILGVIVVWMAWTVTTDAHHRSWWRWGLMGLAAGLGWWTNGLIIAFCIPAALLLAYDAFQRRAWRVTLPLIALAAVGFVIGSLPWWVFNFQNDLAALRFYLGDESSAFAGASIPTPDLAQRFFGLFVLGLPAVFGLRPPWTPNFTLPVVGLVVLVIYIFALYRAARGGTALTPKARVLLLVMIGIFVMLFIASRFSSDPTGRYFLPLILPLSIIVGAFVTSIPRRLGWIALAVVIGFNAFGIVQAISTPPGLTTQFDLTTHIPNDDDDALIALLDEHDLHHGYTNYWVSFRLAFLSDDRMQYSAALPYKANFAYTRFDNRYPPYVEATENAERIAYITANIVEVKDALEAWFADQNITYEYAQVGVYHVYYDFAPIMPRPPIPFMSP